MSETPESTATPSAVDQSINGDVPATESATPSTTTPAGTTAAEVELTTAPETATEDAKPGVDVENAKLVFQERARSYLVEQQQHVVIPSYAAWFNINGFHSIEKKSFPDFFPAKSSPDEYHSVYKTADIYKNVRDFMINAYRVNPLEYLTVTAVRRNLAGDVSSIIRIHHFLEKWGLINYQIDPRTKSSVVGPQYTGHFQITLDTPNGLVPFIPESAEKKSGSAGAVSTPTTTTASKEVAKTSPDAPIKAEEDDESETIPLNLEIRRNVYTKSSDLSKKVSTSSIQFFCNICGKECTKTRYHNLKTKNFTQNPNSTSNNASVVCVTCFDQGLFPSNFYSSDFLKLKEEVLEDDQKDIWTEQEVLLLLEGVEIFSTFDPSNNNTIQGIQSNNNQWDKIADHIGTKSKEECLLKFIQLPIEDRYLTKLSKSDVSSKKKQSSAANSQAVSIKDIVEEIVNNRQTGAAAKVGENASGKADSLSQDQQQLINQIVELTLEKVSIKLENIDQLEQNLIASEKKLQQERKQVLYERWSQYEKINRYKQAQPELTPILDDLLSPVKVQEVVKVKAPTAPAQQQNHGDREANGGDHMEVDVNGELTANPVSLSNPKGYQFWSG